MNNFNFVDRVMVVDTISGTIIDINSGGIVVECDDPQKGVNISRYPNKRVLWPYENQVKPIAQDRHELHITSDGITTNAVYKLNGKVEKTAKAVCCPSDTYDFNTGAELAINRVLYGTDYNPREVAFKEPMQNEPKEPIMLYCVKDMCCNSWLTVGKIYESVDGNITVDTGEIYTDKYMIAAGYLIRAEKRPALVGEYVLLTNVLCPSNYHNGEIYRVTEISPGKPVINGKIWSTVLLQSEYLVLPDYQPEKVEPFKPYLTLNGEKYGVVGEATKYTDENGRPLLVGDVVMKISTSSGSTYGPSFVVKSETYGNHEKAFVMGIEADCNGETGKIKNWKVVKIKSYTEITNEERHDGIEYRGEQSC